MFEDIKLSINSEATTQRETPHGVLRTLFVPPQAHQEPINLAQLQVRYDDTRLVFALTTGRFAEPLADKTIKSLWEQFPAPDTTMRQFADVIQAFLSGDARTVGDDDSRHAIVIGAFSREINTGRGWLAWLGTSGVYILDRNNEPMTLETGLTLGEGWSPQSGIMPEAARIHTDVILTNTISRLLVFTNVLRPIITEVTSLGRAAVQRIATAQAQQLAAVLLDLKTYPVVKVPSALSLFYRWEDATHTTLFWIGAEEASGYRVEQATLPSFEDATLLAELSDSRQRIYTVQPPVNHEVFYRVIPMVGDVPGKPSNSAVVTPVPLVAPVIESINWLANGGLRITWTNIVQANAYELESSPDPDFDSPETAIIYRGSTAMHETAGSVSNGWYYRVRSLNTHFAPRSPSFWSQTRRAPLQLDTPQLVNISQEAISWIPVLGAKSYEVRCFKGHDEDGHSTEQTIIAVEETHYSIQDNEPSVYQVRAVRDIGDEFSASSWSYPATVGAWEGDLSVATLVDQADAFSQTLEAPRPAPAKAALEVPDMPTEPIVAPASTAWRVLLVAAAGALALGLIVGLIGGPRLGIGLDPTHTPLTSGDRMATDVQATQLWARSTERANLSDQLLQSEAVGTEQSVSATAEAERLGRLSNTATADSASLATRDAQLVELGNTATADSASLATLDAQLVELGNTATADSVSFATLDTQIIEYAATATAGAQQLETLQADNELLIAKRNELMATSTVEAAFNATTAAIYQSDVNSLNTLIDENVATISAMENMLATTQAQLLNVATAATGQAAYVSTLEANYYATATALAPTATPTPNPNIFGKQD